MSLISSAYQAKKLLEKFVEPVLLLLIRIYMWDIFYTSGKNKLDNYLNDDWGSTVYLFEEIHPVPLLSPNVAAALGTASELVLSVLVLFGLLTRLSAFALLGVVGVIELALRANDPECIACAVHIMWALLLATLVVRGAGKISCDTFFFRKKIRVHGLSE